MPKKNHTKVIKVYLSRDEKPSDHPQAFPRIPRLYLELLENKSKIKQDLVNKEHIPSSDVSSFPTVKRISSEHTRENYDDRYKDQYNEPKEMRRNEKTRDLHRNKSPDPSSPIQESDNEDQNSLEIIDSDDEENLQSGDEIKENVYNQKDKYKDNTRDDDDDKYGDDTRDNDDKYGDDTRDNDDKYGDNDRYHNYDDKESNRSNDELSERLKELLNDTDDDRSTRSDDSFEKIQKGMDRSRSNRKGYNQDYNRDQRSDKYSRRHYDSFNHKSVHRSEPYRSVHNGSPPTLAELQAQGAYHGKEHLRDINQINMNEQESDDKKRELLFKFELLKKSYPTASIPEFSIHSDLISMQRSYDDSVRRLSLDSTVENYKTYLIGGFMLVEFIFGNFLGFDMQGFTQQQILSMNSYEKLLIELGEKSYVPKGSKWPVELRLLFLIIMNAAFFIVSKMIMRKTGANLMNMINGMNVSSAPRASISKKRKMRGPNINIDDIPESGNEG